MPYLNKVFLMGHVGYAPELREAGKTKVANFSIATTERYNGNERTDWHKIVAFGKWAEIVSDAVGKGSLVLVEGKIQTNQWEDKNGVKRKDVSIVVANIKFLDRKSKADTDDAF